MRQWYLRLNRIGELGLRGTALWGEICVGGEIVRAPHFAIIGE